MRLVLCCAGLYFAERAASSFVDFHETANSSDWKHRCESWPARSDWIMLGRDERLSISLRIGDRKKGAWEIMNFECIPIGGIRICPMNPQQHPVYHHRLQDNISIILLRKCHTTSLHSDDKYISARGNSKAQAADWGWSNPEWFLLESDIGIERDEIVNRNNPIPDGDWFTAKKSNPKDDPNWAIEGRSKFFCSIQFQLGSFQSLPKRIV